MMLSDIIQLNNPHTLIFMCTYTTVLTIMSNTVNPTPSVRPKSTPRNTIAMNTIIRINCTLNK